MPAHTVEAGAHVADVSPLRALAELKSVRCDQHFGRVLSDLSPLGNMPLTDPRLANVPVTDLTPLKGSTTLTHLDLWMTVMSELSPLNGMPLEHLAPDVRAERDADISPSRAGKSKIAMWFDHIFRIKSEALLHQQHTVSSVRPRQGILTA